MIFRGKTTSFQTIKNHSEKYTPQWALGEGIPKKVGLGEGLIDPFIYLIDNYAPDEGRESLVVV